MVAAEMFPFAKVGGLGDVMGALPAALAAKGHRVRVLLPAYRALRIPSSVSLRPYEPFPLTRVPGSGGSLIARFHGFDWEGVEVILVAIPSLFEARMAIYGEGESERFIAFSRAAAALVRASDPLPDVVHLHDHHTALVAPMLKESGGKGAETPVVLTIHNLAYQGITEARAFALTGLPDSLMAPMGPCEFHGRLNALKAGIVSSDAVTAVSPTYAREILTSEGGFGLDGVLLSCSQKLVGILNGIDGRAWSPATDGATPVPYEAVEGIGSVVMAKAINRQVLRHEIGLDPSERPLVAFVSRMTPQKGVDLALSAASEILGMGFDMAFLGTGDPAIERQVAGAASRFPGRVAARLSFDERMARRVLAGSDFLLMPSRFEPCGLTQMYAMAYGTLPVARRTGGLADSVVDLDASPGEGTGFLFDAASPDAIASAFARARRLARSPARLHAAILRGMSRDFSWDRSAGAYEGLYWELAGGGRGEKKEGEPRTEETEVRGAPEFQAA